MAGPSAPSEGASRHPPFPGEGGRRHAEDGKSIDFTAQRQTPNRFERNDHVRHYAKERRSSRTGILSISDTRQIMAHFITGVYTEDGCLHSMNALH